jgi:GntR family transcriptional regulator, transcriptional repressor for pyruvate dehydrogenase complex
MLQYDSLVDKIATDLHQQILQRKLKPGQRLPSERSLCGTFGVGRTTIREALKSLVVRGLVTRQGRGAVIADPEFLSLPGADLAGLAAHTSIKQLFEMRKLLEVRMAGWAAMRATAEDIKSMRSAIDAQISRNTTAGNPSRMFHDALAKAVHNPVLLQIYESGRTLFFRLPFFWKLFDEDEVKTVRAWRHELARRWHEQILQAIEQHDAAEAEGAMFQHLDIMEKDLLSRLQRSSGEPTRAESYSHPSLVDIHADKHEVSERKRLKR